MRATCSGSDVITVYSLWDVEFCWTVLVKAVFWAHYPIVQQLIGGACTASGCALFLISQIFSEPEADIPRTRILLHIVYVMLFESVFRSVLYSYGFIAVLKLRHSRFFSKVWTQKQHKSCYWNKVNKVTTKTVIRVQKNVELFLTFLHLCVRCNKNSDNLVQCVDLFMYIVGRLRQGCRISQSPICPGASWRQRDDSVVGENGTLSLEKWSAKKHKGGKEPTATEESTFSPRQN